MNYQIKINLLKFKNSGVINIKGSTESKQCVVIPIEDNHLYLSVDESLKPKGVYIDAVAWENNQPSQYGDSHGIRQSLSKEVRDKMTDDELKAVPFIGNARPMVIQQQTANVSTIDVSNNNIDDLPF